MPTKEEIEDLLADAPQTMGTATVAKYVGVTPKTVRMRCRAGEMRHLRDGKVYTVPKPWLIDYMLKGGGDVGK